MYRFFISLVFCLSFTAFLSAQEATQPEEKEPETKEEVEEAAADEALEALESLRETILNKTKEREALVAKIKPEEDKEETADLDELAKEIGGLENQFISLAVGTEALNYNREPEPFDPQAEVLKLSKPILDSLVNLTASSRELGALRSEVAEAERRKNIAERALDSLNTLSEKRLSPDMKATLGELQAEWQERFDQSSELLQAMQGQMQVREQSGGFKLQGSIGEIFGSIGQRLLTFLLAALAAAVAWFFFVFLRWLVELIFPKAPNQAASVPKRAFNLVTTILGALTAGLAAIAVFNLRNDWLFMALGVLLFGAAVWALMKAIPGMMETIRTLLNLGAVQEHERLVFEGVPYNVEKLWFYSRLYNPLLDGGDFDLPVTDLSGMYSRPAAKGEPWFPTVVGDWVLLEDDKIAQVLRQTPEIVELVRLGGMHISTPTTEFLAAAPKNLSKGFRVETEFGIDYSHQQQATGDIRAAFKQKVIKRLPEMIPQEQINDVMVDFFSAGSSSLDFEIEVDLKGEAAPMYEEIARHVQAILVDACSEMGLTIPFPQLTMHRV